MSQASKTSRTLIGVVTSDKRHGTRTVEVSWSRQHPRYKKVVQRRTRCQVHDPENNSNLGDKVLIKLIPPVSKTKTWQLVNVIEKAR